MQGLLGGFGRLESTPQVRTIDFGGNGLQHRRQIGRFQFIKMAAHQGQT